MTILFTPIGKEDNAYWEKNHSATLKKINKLMDAIVQTPFAGMGNFGWLSLYQHDIDVSPILVCTSVLSTYTFNPRYGLVFFVGNPRSGLM